MRKRKMTVSVGIPAYNEEANIKSMLLSVLTQRGSFRLESVDVYCDGSTDKTVQIVEKLAKKNSMIKVHFDNLRLGKAGRLNQIYAHNKSDLLATIDADVILESPLAIDIAVKEFVKNPKLLVCTLKNVPVKQDSFVGKVSNSSFFLWQEAAMLYKNGRNVHTCLGSASLIRGDFARHLKFPEGTIGDQGYLYLRAKQDGLNTYLHTTDAKVCITTVSTWEDYLVQGTRAVHSDKENMRDFFGRWADEEYYIPFKYKLAGVLKRFGLDPFYTFWAILFAIYIRLFPVVDPLNKKGYWTVVNSSKKLISKKHV